MGKETLVQMSKEHQLFFEVVLLLLLEYNLIVFAFCLQCAVVSLVSDRMHLLYIKCWLTIFIFISLAPYQYIRLYVQSHHLGYCNTA